MKRSFLLLVLSGCGLSDAEVVHLEANERAATDLARRSALERWAREHGAEVRELDGAVEWVEVEGAPGAPRTGSVLAPVAGQAPTESLWQLDDLVAIEGAPCVVSRGVYACAECLVGVSYAVAAHSGGPTLVRLVPEVTTERVEYEGAGGACGVGCGQPDSSAEGVRSGVPLDGVPARITEVRYRVTHTEYVCVGEPVAAP